MNSRYVVLLATSIFAISSTSTQVSAATKTKQQLNLKVAAVHRGDRYITGTATAGAKVKVTRYAKTFGTGKVAKSGKFKFELKQPVKANWHYRLTVTKKGYKAKVIHFGVVKKVTPAANQNSDVAKLLARIEQLEARLNQTQPNSDSAEVTVLKNQIANLQAQIDSMEPRLLDVYEEKPEWKPYLEQIEKLREENSVKYDLFALVRETVETTQSNVDYYKDRLNEKKIELQKDQENQSLQLEVYEVEKRYVESLDHLEKVKAAHEKVGNHVLDLKQEMDGIDLKIHKLYDQLKLLGYDYGED
ncbi:hypothetical protein FD04_GL000418 [Secundilactobacillus odoratitofui DSM 19909 = JCM 15043]|uniref:Bacterial Ig domain-containing protein n=1 Tax=Secundilactobacillus odoratitofui DSM 19909 = JCM 15043 TaxID=1423776 RepID=A0A0R1LSD7_9LACO|nr:Ig-like domain-containing protein [Secundilactobacillus odoratitofui]KRK98683.1 hypothetical protein FD04_GL000418 [Secundilactobacillus odoratitofui DSM 19909 = JCM 15043]